MLALPYLEAHGFGQLQNQFWRPGEAFYTLQEAPRHHRRAGLEHGQAKKMQWAFGKAHESDGSEEESKAREAKPPDGLDKESHAYETKWICNSHTAQEEYSQGPMTRLKDKAQQEVKQGEAQFVWARGEEEETWLQEPKSKKRPFHIWCWTCTRKRGLDKAQEKAQFVGLMNSLMGFMFY